jgi:hypothetical protein
VPKDEDLLLLVGFSGIGSSSKNLQ